MTSADQSGAPLPEHLCPPDGDRTCVGLAAVVGELKMVNTRLSSFHETMADLRDLLKQQNGRVRDLEIQRWKFDGSLSALLRLGSLTIGALGAGAGLGALVVKFISP